MVDGRLHSVSGFLADQLLFGCRSAVDWDDGFIFVVKTPRLGPPTSGRGTTGPSYPYQCRQGSVVLGNSVSGFLADQLLFDSIGTMVSSSSSKLLDSGRPRRAAFRQRLTAIR